MKKIIPLLSVLFILFACSTIYPPFGYAERENIFSADSSLQYELINENSFNKESELEKKLQIMEFENSRMKPIPGDAYVPPVTDPNSIILDPINPDIPLKNQK